jgi:hypothetical protein
LRESKPVQKIIEGYFWHRFWPSFSHFDFLKKLKNSILTPPPITFQTPKFLKSDFEGHRWHAWLKEGSKHCSWKFKNSKFDPPSIIDLDERTLFGAPDEKYIQKVIEGHFWHRFWPSFYHFDFRKFLKNSKLDPPSITFQTQKFFKVTWTTWTTSMIIFIFSLIQKSG